MKVDHQPLSCAELVPLTLEPSWADQDPDHRHLLAVDLANGVSVSAADRQRVADWLKRQTVPVVGFGEGCDAALADAVDVVLTTEAELERAVANIERNPIAAAVLVQVLSSTCELDLLPALNFESLAYATLQSGREFEAWLADHRAQRPRAEVSEPDDIVLVSRVSERLDIVLNSPQTRNSMSVRMRDALTDAFKLVVMDDGITQVNVSANGPVFSSGGELNEFGLVEDPAAGHRIRVLRNPARYLALRAERYTFHVHRACIGAGIELPAFAGRLTATANTFFQLPELAMGLIPGAGGCVSLPRRIGRQRTAYMALLGKRITAERALEWGLIDAIVD